MCTTQITKLSDETSRLSGEFAERLIDASGATPADCVMIAGYQHLDLLIALCRRGFARAMCQAEDQGPNGAGPVADVLLVPGVRNDAELVTVITRLGRNVRAGGKLVLRDARGILTNRTPYMRRLLADHGFTLVRQVLHPANAGMILHARKQGAAAQFAAA
jgi:hypothetical protein